MTWLAVIALAVAAFAAGAALLRGRVALWTLFAAALVFGLAGFAQQASPELPAATGDPRAAAPRFDPALVEARRGFFSELDPPARFVLTADSFARRGRIAEASGFLSNAVADDPRDGEAWLALGIALVERADGRLTPPAAYAFERARDLLPGNPGPAFFAGLAQLRGGLPDAARATWTEGLATAAPDARGLDLLRSALVRLNGPEPDLSPR